VMAEEPELLARMERRRISAAGGRARAAKRLAAMQSSTDNAAELLAEPVAPSELDRDVAPVPEAVPEPVPCPNCGYEYCHCPVVGW